VFEVINECIKEELNDKEIYWINHYDCCNNGYNQEYGGNCSPVTEETKLKISIAGKGRIVSKETRLKLSLNHAGGFKKGEGKEWKVGERTIRKGHCCSEETKIKLRKPHKSYKTRGPMTEEHKRKISLSEKGRIVSEESKLKMRLAKTNTSNITIANISKVYGLLNSGKINKGECARICNITYATLHKYLKIIESRNQTYSLDTVL